jgi:hypothetical protein
VLLALKLILVPGLVAAVTLGARRWGPRVGGWLTSLPLVAGPGLYFLAVEQGDPFAAEASRATLVGLIAVAAFAVAYAWTALRRPWPAGLLAGWAAFAAATVVLQAVRWPPLVALPVVLASFVVARRLLPPERGALLRTSTPAWDLPLRMAGALALVLTVTHLADRLGPRLSGALTPFPVALAILLAFVHAQQGSAVTIRFLYAFLPAMGSFAVFTFVLTLAMVPLGRDAAFALAVAAQLAGQGLTLWRLRRQDGRA